MNSFYKYLSASSIDIVAGALSMCYAINYTTGHSAGIYVYLVLGLVVWLIYTSDHLVDVYRKRHVNSFRHDLHKKYFNFFISCSLFIAGLSLFLIFRLPKEILISGILIGASLILLRIFEIWRNLPTKEWSTGIFYTCGVGIVAISYGTLSEIWVPLAVTFILSVQNGLILSFFDFSSDIKSGSVSFSTRFGIRKSMFFIRLLFLGGLVVMILISRQGFTADHIFWMIFLVIGLSVHAFTYRSRTFFFNHLDWLRPLLDGIYILTGIMTFLI